MKSEKVREAKVKDEGEYEGCTITVQGGLPRAIMLTHGLLRRFAADFAARAGRRIGVPFREVSIILQNDRQSARTHRTIMGVKGPTDVITQRFDPMPGEKPGIYGELYVNGVQAVRAAPNRKGWDVDNELLLYVAHGIDHLAGADDATPEGYADMRKRELKWIKQLY